MVDFLGSLQKGLGAAQQAEKNKSEILSVFHVLNKQLSEAYQGKLSIEIFNRINPFAAIIGFAGAVPKPEYSFVGAKNHLAEDASPIELAGWKIDANGYPCQIITSDSEVYCEDKAALEKALQHLLSRPDVGEKLYTVLNRKLKVVVE